MVDPILHNEKREKYFRDEGTAIDLMFRSLSLDDQALYDEYDSAFSLWAYLRSKYQQIDSTTANEYMTLIQNFSFDDMTITQGWDKLKEYRRKLCAADIRSKHAYQDEALLLILIRSLPSEYVATIDTLDALTELSVEEKLKRLQTKETRLISSHRNENAFPSYSRDKDTGYSPTCYLCRRRHFIKACPFMEFAQDAVEEYIRTAKSIHKTSKNMNSGHSSLSRTRSPSHTRPYTKMEKKVGFKGKDRAYEARTSSDLEFEEDSDSDSDVLTHEHAQISRELISR